ncbi:uncharacterized protein N7482_003335 [Penicillium canariense]|uniref:Uncharacterized protein n=1 Tax=Penicillium canariense TaxID=189055 RepID=A0A9W9LP20_9EURO|nr:uncharacterized protein N7482_003335 [Penicillium canariense]KAJ5167741.1 hypothetical protein N7482_003335 [Penicillium canariense]
MTTYLRNNAITQEIELISRRRPESVLYGVWTAILALQFPITRGYVTRPQDQHTSQGGQRGFSDLHIFQYAGNATQANKFLMVQCKTAGTETRTAIWDDAVDQLSRYLSSSHGTRRRADRTPVYGIAAIGRCIRVYKYDDVNRQVLDWAPRGMTRGAIWDVKDHARQVQRILDHILDNH